jgi:hypothetical protein
MIKAKYRNRIKCYMFVNERILQLRYKLQSGYLKLLAVYVPVWGGGLNKRKNSIKVF